MDSNKLEKTIARFWQSKGKNSLYYLGRCADFSYSLKKFLGTGDYYLVGKWGNTGVAFHTVLKHNEKYWDVRGGHTIEEVRRLNPIASFNNEVVTRASSSEIQHIHSLLNIGFVNDTIEGLKRASEEV